MKKKYMKLVGLMMALGLSLGIAACGGVGGNSGTTGGASSSASASVESSSISEVTSSSVADSSSSVSAENSSVEEKKVGDYTAETWAQLVSLSSFENCTVDLSVICKKGVYDMGETSKHLFSADGYSRTGNRSVMGDGTGKQDLEYATDDADTVESERAALLGFLAEIAFEDITYNATPKTYVVNGEFYTANGKTYKDVTIKVSKGKISTVGVTIVTDDGTQTDTLTFSKYNTTTPALPEEE